MPGPIGALMQISKEEITVNTSEKQKSAVFTVCNLAYLPRALVLADSVMKHNNSRLKIYIFDKKIDFDDSQLAADLFWIEELGVPNLQELAFQYDIIEFSTSLKPFLALNLMKSHEKVIFLDPDTCLFHSLAPILDDLDHHDIVLTPHYTTPQPRHPSESDQAMMRFGSFNLGFFGVRDSEEGRSFLNWWSERCIDFSFMESQFGLSTDQKWVTIAPCLFPGIFVSFNLGYNAAAWNTFEREIARDEKGGYVVNGRFPLIFFHFSNFDASDPGYLNKRASSEMGRHYPILHELGVAYGESLSAMSAIVGPRKYAYDYMSDGQYISPTLRRAYAAVRSELPENHDPFDGNGPVGRFARKNHLLEKSGKKFVPQGRKDALRNGTVFWIIYGVMRATLWCVGPNRFANLSRLMVHLSMYRVNRNMWKI